MFFVRFRKPSPSNFHDIFSISPGYLHGSGSPPFGIYSIFTCFSYGLKSLRLRISMIFPEYFHGSGIGHHLGPEILGLILISGALTKLVLRESLSI